MTKEELKSVLDLHAESAVTKQLEKIASAIRALEGLPVDFRLARKLSDVLGDIACMCAPQKGSE